MGSGIGSGSAGGIADIQVYAQTRGLFAGVQLSGDVLTTDTNANNAYYGRDLAARQIVIQMDANNPGADPLRAILTRLGGPVEALLPPAALRPRELAATGSGRAPTVSVQRQALPPPPPPPPR